jgi:sulfopyruvate decarboxylase TPP-binding subunit
MEIFSGPEIVAELTWMGVSHVIWIPDSTLGRWEPSLEAANDLRLVRVCREGEAWPLAAGLLLAGKSPLVMLQTTGLFESGDAWRNVVYDLQLPVFAIIGARSWHTENSPDSARRFARAIIDAWQMDCELIQSAGDKPKLRERYLACRANNSAGAVLLAE